MSVGGSKDCLRRTHIVYARLYFSSSFFFQQGEWNTSSLEGDSCNQSYWVEDSLSLENQIAYRNKTPDFTLYEIGCKLCNVLIIDVCCGMDGLWTNPCNALYHNYICSSLFFCSRIVARREYFESTHRYCFDNTRLCCFGFKSTPKTNDHQIPWFYNRYRHPWLHFQCTVQAPIYIRGLAPCTDCPWR